MPEKKRDKLMIIDGNALIHRSFHALPTTLTTKDGTIVNAVYGFTSFLLKAFLEFRPQYAALTLDRKAPTFRHEEYSAYKGTRTKAPDELYDQIPLVKEVAAALDMPIYELDGFEADDLIGTITKRAEDETAWENYIVTGDMDSLQLVSPRTKVYMMSRGLNDSVTYDAAKVEERYGLKPAQIIDYKALRGDPSDNIPGVKGIGEKTATELLQKFHNLDGVYHAVNKQDPAIKPRLLDLLKTDKAQAYLSQELATIKRDVPLDIEWEKFRLNSFDLEKATALFTKLEFRSLLNKLTAVKEDSLPAKEEKKIESAIDKFTRNRQEKKYRLVTTPEQFKEFLERLKQVSYFSFDTETSSLDPLTATIVGLSFSWETDGAYYLDILNHPEWLDRLAGILTDPKIKKSGHNLKFDYRVLKNNGITVAGMACDTMLASYLLNPDNRQHSLDAVSFRELGWEKIKTEEIIGKGKDQISFSQADPEKVAQYSGEDANCTWQLTKKLTDRLQKEKLAEVLSRIDLPLVPVLGNMEDNGIILEPKILKTIEKDLAKRLAKLTTDIYRLAGETFNINSPRQLQEILFEKLAISSKNIKKTKTGFSTADEELIKISEEHEIVPLIKDYREATKLQNTYVIALPALINQKTGRIHTSFNQTIAATGRLSSTEPNLQNIPTRTPEGQKIRTAFVAAKGWKLLSLDYSQIELRLAAHLSGDSELIKAFKDGADIHRITAAAINEVAPEQVTKTMRREAKAINFGILYGQGPHGLALSAGIPYKKAQLFIAKYFETYPKIKKLVDHYIDQAKKNGYTVTLFGRKRFLPEINSQMVAVRHAAERMAINTPIQGTAADIIKLAMIDIARQIEGQEKEIKMLLQIHDELVFEIQEDRVTFWLPKLKAAMENVLPLKVPVIAEPSVGNNWGELK